MLAIAGFRTGDLTSMTLKTRMKLESSDIIACSADCVEMFRAQYPAKKFYETHMGREREDCLWAIERARTGLDVTVVCSGDNGIYEITALAYELAEGEPDVEIEPIPGVTAACSGGAVLGAPLTGDFAVISLTGSDTPFELVVKRLSFACMADMVICLYNPSGRKIGYLRRACDVMLRYRKPETICGYVVKVGRSKRERCRILDLKELRDSGLTAFSTIFIGNSATRNINGKMVTPWKPAVEDK